MIARLRLRHGAGPIKTASIAHGVTTRRIGIRGMQGPKGDAAPLSLDANNRLRLGDDGGLFVPDDLLADPTAYYILARN